MAEIIKREVIQMDKIYNVYHDGTRKKKAYSQICHDLGFLPDAGFVRITTAGTISFTAGKPDEIRALLRAVNAKRYRASRALQDTVK